MLLKLYKTSDITCSLMKFTRAVYTHACVYCCL